MKKPFWAIVILGLIICCRTSYSQDWPLIFHPASNSWVELEDLYDAMGESQVVFVGEQHNHTAGHQLELAFLERFWDLHGDVAVGLEMFERDVQHLVAGYLDGEISEKFFLSHSRPWKNYLRDYRPLIEFARSMGSPVLALNVPRRYAAHVVKGKEKILGDLPDAEKKYLALPIVASQGRYRDKFYATMADGHAKPEMWEFYYRAQCLKDDTMALSLIEFLQENPDYHVICYAGAFHSDERLGMVAKTLAKMPALTTLVITIIAVENWPVAPEKYKDLADYIIFAPK